MEKTFRSLILKYFPPELMVELDILTESHGIDNNTKTRDYVIPLLKKYNVPFSPLGNGTNRYGILIDGYAVKIALDRMGKIDNQREFKYSYNFYPDVVKVYESSYDGLISVFEYITIFSLDDFIDRQDEMREILGRITENFLVGDIGVSQDNYVNWGTRPDGSIAILDFAYIYSLSYKGFKCSCDNGGILEFDADYNYLICPFCHKKYQFRDIRKRISKQDEINEIGNIFDTGYILSSEEETHELLKSKSPFSFKKVKENKEKKSVNKDASNKNSEVNLTLDEINKFIGG